MTDLAHEFEPHRGAIEALGYRMLGSAFDAQDLAQETYLRWIEAAPKPGELKSLRSWLLKVASRLALDRLKSAQRKRMTYVGPWLPEPWLVDDNSPADAATTDDSVTIALMLAMERLTPAERAAFLLHDVFGFSFDEVAETLGKSAAACRKLTSRARASVREDRPRFALDHASHRRLLAAFFAACESGDLARIKELLASDAVAISDSGGKAIAARRVLHSADHVSRFCAGVFASAKRFPKETTLEFTRFNGLPGILLRENGVLVTSFSLAIANGRIAQLFIHRNPDKLAAFGRTDARTRSTADPS